MALEWLFVEQLCDKAANIREIADRLNIGLDAMVFVDDNPFERAIVRRELPMVAVPELPADPALYAACLADAGYFEGLRLTAERVEGRRNRLESVLVEQVGARDAIEADQASASGR